MKINRLIKLKNKIKQTYYIEERDKDNNLLFYNPWTDVVTDKNPAIYIALTAEVSTTSLLTVNTSLNRQQRE
ncbi:3852_t:CDS:1, partial [Racocetra persica]